MAKTNTRKKNKNALAIHKHLKHALVPHKGNHYRPHLVRLHGLTAILILALVLQFAYGFMNSGRLEVLGRVSNVSVDGLLAETNSERVSSGLTALEVNNELNQAAYLKAQDMFAGNYWAHTSPTGTSPWYWLGQVGYNYNVAGENLAKNYPTADATVSAWMASESHRANILNGKYQDIGFAVVSGMLDGRDTTLVVAYYGADAATAVEGDSDTQPVAFAAPVGDSTNPLTYFGTAIQSLSPATLGALAMLAIAAVVALGAHHYRNKLPKAWRQSWRVHHGMYTFVGIAGLAVLMILATGGGQI